MTKKDVVWAAWLAGLLGAFAVLETIAYRKASFPTLSNTLSRALGTHPESESRRGPLGVLLFAAGWLVLTWHLAKYRPRIVIIKDPVAEAEEILRGPA